tara:strand:+ start:573 stop:839 length:267 start_codon:yes stop_codon:yes gene_type:complete
MIDNDFDNVMRDVKTRVSKNKDCFCGGGAITPHNAGVIGCYRELCFDSEIPKVNDFTLKSRGYSKSKNGEWTRIKSGESSSAMADTEW